jgi:hypothetical protein
VAAATWRGIAGCATRRRRRPSRNDPERLARVARTTASATCALPPMARAGLRSLRRTLSAWEQARPPLPRRTPPVEVRDVLARCGPPPP